MFIIWEGIDKTGKDTLRLALDKATNYKHINIVRGPIGYMVYNELYRGITDHSEYLNDWNKIKDNCLVVHCCCIMRECVKRGLAAGEKQMNEEELWRAYNMLLRKLYENCPEERMVRIDTDLFDVKNCIDIVMYKINQLSVQR